MCDTEKLNLLRLLFFPIQFLRCWQDTQSSDALPACERNRPDVSPGRSLATVDNV